ncbi:hypothetical protein [Streptacidiphilus carbonis]|uniref:hypothetical protein n=1 Tax=Streptacidiphilus carbonis TaxID=105422 RepID=UPI0005A65C17|nr:hypothetical protein [Streptacidiphilus carbonis]
MARKSSGPDKPAVRKAHHGRYGAVARVSDHFNGGRDGKKTLPDIELDGSVSTPTLEFHAHRAASAQHVERIRYLMECEELAVSVSVLRQRLATAGKELDQRQQAVTDLSGPLSDEQLGQRRAGEHRTAEAIVRSRRAAERARPLAAARLARTEAADRVSALELELSSLEALLSVRQEIAASRAAFIHENALRRVASYFRRLVRRHPQGQRINAALKPGGPELPSWANGSDGALPR